MALVEYGDASRTRRQNGAARTTQKTIVDTRRLFVPRFHRAKTKQRTRFACAIDPVPGTTPARSRCFSRFI
jgi:hypothetical protein